MVTVFLIPRMLMLTGVVTIGGAAYTLSPAALDIVRRLFVRDGQRRQELSEALSSRHDRAAVADGLRELVRLGFLTSERA